MRLADEHTAWPVGAVRHKSRIGLARANNYPVSTDIAAQLRRLAAYAVGRVPARGLWSQHGDACDRTHMHVRADYRRASDASRASVHRIERVIDQPYPRPASVYVTGCGAVIWRANAVRTAAAVTCPRPGCARPPENKSAGSGLAFPGPADHAVTRQKQSQGTEYRKHSATPIGRRPRPCLHHGGVRTAESGSNRGRSKFPPDIEAKTDAHNVRAPRDVHRWNTSRMESAAAHALDLAARAEVPYGWPSVHPAEGLRTDGIDPRQAIPALERGDRTRESRRHIPPMLRSSARSGELCERRTSDRRETLAPIPARSNDLAGVGCTVPNLPSRCAAMPDLSERK